MGRRAQWGSLLVGMTAAWAAPAAGPNAVDPARLAPRLLRDGPELTRFIADFPLADYRLYEVPGMGSFYLQETLEDAIKSRLREGSLWEPHVRDLLTRWIRRGSTVLDVGAHIGTHSIWMASLAGPEGLVYAFEPQRNIYRELVWNLRANDVRNVVPLRFALGDKSAVVHMEPTVAGNEGHTAVGQGGDAVEMRTLDSFGFRNVSFLKVDVEGYEDPVLRGARQLLARDRPFISLEIMGGYKPTEDPAGCPPEIHRRMVGTIGLLRTLNYDCRYLQGWDYVCTYGAPSLDRHLVDCGNPDSRPFLASGFYPDEKLAEGTMTWSQGGESQVYLWLQPRPGPYVLEARLCGGEWLGDQSVALEVNGSPAANLTVAAGWQSIRLPLPAGLLRPGENTLTWRYSKHGSPPNGDVRDMAVAFDSLWVRPGP